MGEGPADLVEAQFFQRHGLDDRAWIARAVLGDHPLAHMGQFAVTGRPAGGRLRARQHEAQQPIGHLGAVAEREGLECAPVLGGRVQHGHQPEALTPEHHVRGVGPLPREALFVEAAPGLQREIALAFGAGEVGVDLVKALLFQVHGLDQRPRMPGAVQHDVPRAVGAAFQALDNGPAGAGLRARQHKRQQVFGHLRAVPEREVFEAREVCTRHDNPVAGFGAWKAEKP